MSSAQTDFYLSVPTFDDFSDVADMSVYVPLPAGWLIGMTDVVGSTAAISAGRYKSVNMAGAAGISAVINALGHQEFPFVFGGDGATFAIPPQDRAAAADALSKTSQWVAEEMSLGLRVSLIPAADIRAAGHDVLVARFAVSPGISYAMFAGRGIEWAESQMKQDKYALPSAAPGARPDLTGMSCRWEPIANRRGCIASVLVAPMKSTSDPAYDALVRDVVTDLQRFDRAGHPVPENGPGFAWPPKGLGLEARANRGNRSLAAQKMKIVLEGLIAWVLGRTGWKLGDFDPVHYRRQTAMNTDFRKFDGVLRMTIDCDKETLTALRTRLENARTSGIARYGIFEQAAAIMTCIVPSIMTDDHLHFLDGADGGYARAAEMLKNG